MPQLSDDKKRKNWLILGLIVLWIVIIFGVTIVKMAVAS